MAYRRIAVVMAGGSGERFWPLSRRLRPKQLLRLASPDKALLHQTVERLEPLIGAENVLIATAPYLVEPSREASPSTPPENVLAEPHKRNTAGCLVWVAATILSREPNARESTSIAVVAADHKISPDEGFRATVDAALSHAEKHGGIVTIGIRPERPETGYGYIQYDPAAPNEGSDRVAIRPVVRFQEKPHDVEAELFCARGDYLWNSGTFFWTLDTFLTQLEAAAPDLYAAVERIAGLLAAGKIVEAEDAFARIPSISIDYALMEKASNVSVAEAAFEWDDVGSWDALDRSLVPDGEGNVQQGETVLVDVCNSIVVNENPQVVATLLGVEGLVVVVTEDAVLVCPKDKAQQVRKVVEKLRERGIDRT